MKKINTGKCDAWCEMLIALFKMTKELNDNEARYIKANFSIAFGTLELQELENHKESKEEKKNLRKK